MSAGMPLWTSQSTGHAAVTVAVAVRRSRASGLWFMMTIMMLSVLGFSATPAYSQELLPGPISTPELTRYVERLGLSVQQQLAIESLHDEYKVAFRDLQEREIKEFNERTSRMMGANMPSRAQVEEMLRGMDRLAARVAALDEQLFDQMQPMLTEQQLASLPRVRMARERTRFSANQMMWSLSAGEGDPADLSEMVLQLDLTAEQRSDADALLIEYERNMVRTMAQLNRRVSRMFLDLFDALEKAGFDEQSMQDPEMAMQMMETMQTIFHEISRDAMELNNRLYEQNKRTYSMLRTVLPPAAARQLRAAYYLKAYSWIGWMANQFVAEEHLIMDTLPDLEPEKLEELRSRVWSLTADIDRQVDALADEIEAFNRSRDPFNWDPDGWDVVDRKVNALGAQVREVHQQVQATMSEILSQEQLQLVMQATHQQQMAVNRRFTAQPEPIVEAGAGEDDGAIQLDSMIGGWGPDQFLPREINSNDVRLYSRIMQLNDEQKKLLDAALATYSERHQEFQRGPLQSLTEATQNLWRYNPETGVQERPTADRTAVIYERRSAALTALQTVDRSFFDEVERVLADSVPSHLLQRIRLQRERDTFNRRHYMWHSNTQTPSVDALKLTVRMRLSEAEQQRIEPLLADYETRATPLYEQMYRQALAWHRAQDLANVAMWASQEEGQPIAYDWTEHSRIMEEPTRTLQDAMKTMADLNEQTNQAIVAQLDAANSQHLHESFRRIAYPQVFNDPEAVHRQLTRALELRSLTPDQRARLEEVALDYRVEYEDLSEQMKTLYSSMELNVAMPVFNPESMQERTRIQERISQVSFDRRELNSRAVRRLRQTLTPDQLDEVGGLPTLRD